MKMNAKKLIFFNLALVAWVIASVVVIGLLVLALG
jgi:hypothetical protein